MLKKRENNAGMKKYQFLLKLFKQWSQKNSLNLEFHVSYKKPLTRVTVILLTHRIVGFKTELSLTV